MPGRQVLTIGKYTYALVDLDVWLKAIVTDYRGPQDFGNVVCAFAEEYEPPQDIVERIMRALP
jgi:hypothetical protein